MFSDSDGTVMSPSVTGKLCFCKNTLVKVLRTSEGPKFFLFFFAYYVVYVLVLFTK